MWRGQKRKLSRGLWRLALQFLSLAVPLAIQKLVEARVQRVEGNNTSTPNKKLDQSLLEVEKKLEELKKKED